MQSRSEQDGLACLRHTDQHVLSVGISTAGNAEMAMAKQSPNCHITATTLDVDGAASTQAQIDAAGLSDQITVKVEDIAARPVPYHAETFDFVYARLVLHYLSAQSLEIALDNIRAILKKGGRLFVVVRSTECKEVRLSKQVDFDEKTHLTTYRNPQGLLATRYFHTRRSISSALERQGFVIDEIHQFDEDLSTSFDRKNGIWNPNNLIEVLASIP